MIARARSLVEWIEVSCTVDGLFQLQVHRQGGAPGRALFHWVGHVGPTHSPRLVPPVPIASEEIAIQIIGAPGPLSIIVESTRPSAAAKVELLKPGESF